MTEEYKAQSDGRMVAGPDLSSEKGRTGFAPGLIIAGALCLAFLAAGFFGGRATAPTTEGPFPERYVATRVALAKPCDHPASLSEVGIVAIDKPLTDTEIADFRAKLATYGYRNVTIKNIRYQEQDYYYASGCK